jgi:hypothetical protein
MSTRSRPRYPIKWSVKRSDRLTYRERVPDKCFAWVLESVSIQWGCPSRAGRSVFTVRQFLSSLLSSFSYSQNSYVISLLLPFYVHFLFSLFTYFVFSSFYYFLASVRESFSSFNVSQSPYFLPSVFIFCFLLLFPHFLLMLHFLSYFLNSSVLPLFSSLAPFTCLLYSLFFLFLFLLYFSVPSSFYSLSPYFLRCAFSFFHLCSSLNKR